MAGFLYYIPGARCNLKAADLAAKGLAYVLDGPTIEVREVTRGPDNGQGAIVADCRRVPKTGYYPPEQVWRAIPGNPAGAWVGYGTAAKPGPADLARAKMLDGYPVELGDGQVWRCPIARFPWGEAALPRAIELGADGRWVPGAVVAAQAELWALAQRFWEARWSAFTGSDGSEIRFDFDGLHDSAVECLAENYAIGRAEAAQLGLFVTGSALAVLEALIDWPRVLDVLKKTAEADGKAEAESGPVGETSSDPSGSPVDSTDTVPA